MLFKFNKGLAETLDVQAEVNDLITVFYVKQLVFPKGPRVFVDLNNLRQLTVVFELRVNSIQVLSILIKQNPEAAEALSNLISQNLDRLSLIVLQNLGNFLGCSQDSNICKIVSTFTLRI